MIGKPETGAEFSRHGASGDFARAILNILEDAAVERAHLIQTQSAILNMLADAADEKAQLQLMEKAFLNILEDVAGEQLRFAGTQSAMLNVLEDSALETARTQSTQSAMLNVLEDAAGEQARQVDTHRAMLNILEDADAKNAEVEALNRSMEAEIVIRRHAEDSLRAANREAESFSYSVSHDLRAPLRSIDGFSQALLEDCAERLDAEGKHYLGRIRNATQRMALLIDELLKLSRISRAEMRFSAVDLTAIVREIIAELHDRETTRTVEWLVAEGIVAEGDGTLLRIALENLLANAWKFTSKTPAAVIEFGAVSYNGLNRYFVRDNGAGFDERYVGKLFGAFQRLHSDTEFTGIGVGLAIVQRIILRHGGRVWAEGSIGKGATFSFTLHEHRA